MQEHEFQISFLDSTLQNIYKVTYFVWNTDPKIGYITCWVLIHVEPTACGTGLSLAANQLTI